ncbi:hypothetical protein SPF06_01370 [Sinomonas sp. JGH33]|uniref:Phosphatidate cytidylyltransferase n=1 Tax=Sinomonas terricola TaxID=3110330 RepID=A0ABU5T128_9MICC|nr:hypothetical protein [Sinomonas sp. JGH33]MEA5453360.1 hypothetical protein [Sinomonas sp. JGH33]
MSPRDVRRRRSPGRLVFVLAVVAGLLAVTSHGQAALAVVALAIVYAAVEAVIAWRRRR